MSIKLSIIIPVYNSEKYLSECLRSICQQIIKNVEVILINDCSNDASIKICKTYIKKFNFIKLVNLKKNKGVSYCRNVGINLALGEYLCFVDSDDKLLKGSINNILNNVKKFYGKDLFVLRYFVLKDKKISKEKVIKNQIFKSIPNKSLIECINNFDEFMLTCWNFIIKKNFLLRNQIYFKNIKLGEDWVFVSEILCLSKTFKIIQKPTYIYQIHEQATLGKSSGYVYAISRIKVICELGVFISRKKKFLSKKKIKFLLVILKRVTSEMLQGIMICKPNDMIKCGEYLSKYRSAILEMSRFGFKKINFLLERNNNISTNFSRYFNKKNIFLKNIVRKLKKYNLILFCAGNYGRTVCKYFNNNGLEINAIVDNNTKYADQKIGKTIIKSPSYLKKNLHKFSNYKILICNKKINEYNKIRLQLNQIGYKDNNIFYFNEL